MQRSWAWIATFGLGMLSAGCGSNPTPPAPATSTAATSSTPSESSSGGGAESSSGGGAASGGSETASLEMSSSGAGYGSESASSSGGYPGDSSAGAQSGGSQSGSSSYGSEEMAYNGGGAYGGESGYVPPGSVESGSGGPGYGSAGPGYGTQGNRAGGGLLPGMGGAEGALLSRLMGGGSTSAPKMLTFQERSKLAFEAGNWNRAYDLLSAQSLLSDDAESMKIADFYRWSTANKRPVLGMKIAVGLVLDNPSNATSLKPIGTDLQSIMSGGGAGGAAGGSGPGAIGSEGGSSGGYGAEGGMAPPGAAKPALAVGAKPLTDAAGELVTRVIEAFGTHHSEGKWTVAFQENSYKGKPRMPGNNMPGSSGFGAPGSFGNSGGDLYGESGSGPGIGENNGFGGGDLGGSSQSGTPTLQPFRFQQGGGGPGVGSIASGLSGFSGTSEQESGGGNFGQSAPGQFGSGEELPVGSGFGPGAPNGFGGPGSNGSMPGGQGGRMPSPQWVAEDFELPGDVTPLGPCLEYIGSDVQANLIAKSKEAGYEALIVFDVEIILNRRTGIVNNTARVKVLHLAEDPKEIKVIASSKPLVSVTVARARLKKEEDGVEDAAESVAKKSAEIIALQPVPDRLTQDAVVKTRMPKLLADTKISELGKLGEVNFYYQKGFIDDAQRQEFFEAIAGAEASKLLSTRRTEKAEALESLLK